MGLVAQLARFVLIGGFCALVDLGIYQALLALGVYVHLAKAISFVCGTTTAYLLNKRFTFQSAQGGGRFLGFVALYGTTFALNLATNALMLAVLPAATPFRVTLAWVVAQGVATAVNFVMLRTVVFRAPRS
jgi:putative flippase GtrA